MRRSLRHRFTTFFIYAFLMDGVFSVLEVAERMHTHDSDIDPILSLWSLCVGLMGMALFFGMIVTPRLSKRLLLPPLLYLGYVTVWQFFFGNLMEMPLAIAEVLTALGVIFGYKREHQRRDTDEGEEEGHGPGSEPEDAHEGIIPDIGAHRPFFTWRNFIVMGCMNGAIALCIAALVTLALGKRARLRIEGATGKFMKIEQKGISLEERRFRKGDKEIRLIGMMHVAKSGFYDDVDGALPEGQNAVVLLEGVGDETHLLKDRFGYSRMAGLLGIAAQEDSAFMKKAVAGLKKAAGDDGGDTAAPDKPGQVEYQRADIDLADLHPDTVNFVRAVGTIMHSSNFQEMMENYNEHQPELQRGSETAFSDILGKRNAHLLDEIAIALRTHTIVVVPWGAAHMPGLQKTIEQWGFKETTRTQHEAVSFQNRALTGLVWLLDRLPGCDDGEQN